jgi:hypothetical protein
MEERRVRSVGFGGGRGRRGVVDILRCDVELCSRENENENENSLTWVAVS